MEKISKKLKKKHFILIGGGMVIIMVIVVAGFVLSSQTPIPDLKNYGPAGNFELTNQNGNNVTLNTYKGKVLVIDFIYTHCPNECPVESAKMNDLLNKLEQSGFNTNQFHFVSISFDWKYDNQSTMLHYANIHLSDMSQLSYWSFLSGTHSQMNKTFLYNNQNENVTYEYGVWFNYNTTMISNGFSPELPPNNTVEYMNHNFALTIVDTHGIRQSIYPGFDWNLNTEFNKISYLIDHPNFSD